MRASVRPTLLARDATRIAPVLREVCDVVEADQGDVDAVVAATRDADALYWVDPPTDDDDPLDGYRRMSESVARAVRTNRVPRVVFQSSVGAEARHGFGEIDGLGLTEELLNGTGADVTHLRNGYFFSNLLMDLDGIRDGVLTTTHPVDRPLAWVAPLDIATVAATRLLSTDWHGVQTLGVHGPADLSFAQVAQILSDVLGRPVTAQQVGEQDQAQALAGFGMTPAQVDAILGMTPRLRRRVRARGPAQRRHHDPHDARCVGLRAPAAGVRSSSSSKLPRGATSWPRSSTVAVP